MRPFDEHKEAVRSWVPRLRQTLEKHFEELQLRRLGLKPSGKHTPRDKMSLPEDDLAAHRRPMPCLWAANTHEFVAATTRQGNI